MILLIYYILTLRNKIGNEGAKALGNALTINNSIVKLNLEIIYKFYTHKLIYFFLDNQIKDEILIKIEKMIDINKIIKSIIIIFVLLCPCYNK